MSIAWKIKDEKIGEFAMRLETKLEVGTNLKNKFLECVASPIIFFKIFRKSFVAEFSKLALYFCPCLSGQTEFSFFYSLPCVTHSIVARTTRGVSQKLLF